MRQQPRPNYTSPHRTQNQEVPETTQDRHTSTHTPQHLPKERRSAAETRTPASTPTPLTRTGNGGEQEERAHSHAHPKTLTKTGEVQAETQAQPQTPEPQRGKEGRNHKPYPNTPTQDASQGWRGYPNPNRSTTRT